MIGESKSAEIVPAASCVLYLGSNSEQILFDYLSDYVINNWNAAEEYS